MARTGSITIYLSEQDIDLKKMLQDLKKHDGKLNRYSDRSESDIAKMILREALEKAHRHICGKK
jgi:hypothetical protein